MTLRQRILRRRKLTRSIPGKVVPFQRGQPSPATQVGQVPPNFSPGTAANRAKAAALAAYPGGIVNRVVRLSDGEYNVHMRTTSS